MRAILSKFLCLIAAVILMDGHIVALQTYAWATMLHDRLPEQGVSEAVTSTFDGEHPCEHCLTVEKLQLAKQEKEEPASSSSFQLGSFKTTEIALETIAAPSPPLATLLAYERSRSQLVWEFYRSIPTPPPDAAAGLC